VLFDSAPANSYMDSIALAGKVDGVVMVLQSEKTRWEVAQFIRERLESGNGNILGVILNKRRFYIPRWLYKTV
jgi:protein-tyrosine kinase